MYLIDPTNNGFFQDYARFVQHEFCKGEPSEITKDYTRTDGIWILNYVSWKNGVDKTIFQNGCQYIAIQTEDKHCLENQQYMQFLNKAIKVFHYFQRQVKTHL